MGNSASVLYNSSFGSNYSILAFVPFDSRCYSRDRFTRPLQSVITNLFHNLFTTVIHLKKKCLKKVHCTTI